MKTTRTLLVPLFAALVAAPLSGCNKDEGDGTKDSSSDSGNKAGDTGNKDDKGDATKPGGSTGGNDGSGDSTGTGDSGSGGGGGVGQPTPGDIDCSKLEVTGIDLGQVPGSVALVDALGKKVNLHDYCNDIVYVMAGSAF